MSLKPVANPYSGGGCFFCGEKNPIGLKLKFLETESEPRELVCRWQPDQRYRGLGRVLHGGIQSGLFDEIMGWATHYLLERSGVTGSLHITFHRPLYIDDPLELRCRIEGIEGRQVHLSAEITNPAGEVCTRATGTYVLLPGDKFRELVGPGD